VPNCVSSLRIQARWPTDVLQQGGGAGSLRPVALQQHGKYVVDARISPDGALVATASHDKSVNIYSVRCGVHMESCFELNFSYCCG
jgi:WD40 repeat protein